LPGIGGKMGSEPDGGAPEKVVILDGLSGSEFGRLLLTQKKSNATTPSKQTDTTVPKIIFVLDFRTSGNLTGQRVKPTCVHSNGMMQKNWTPLSNWAARFCKTAMLNVILVKFDYRSYV
jgi:hypothetical protein